MIKNIERNSKTGIALKLYFRVSLITLLQLPVRRLTGTDYQYFTANLGNIWETL